MASLRSKAAPLAVGSVPWLSEERASAVQFIDQEVEEFTFAVRNEMDWLNEHLGEVFDENRVWNVAELMKTPGKLRGKTPRTARKRNALETRAPLTEVFATNQQNTPSPSRSISRQKPASPFRVAEDPEPLQTRADDDDQPRDAKPQVDEPTQRVDSVSAEDHQDARPASPLPQPARPVDSPIPESTTPTTSPTRPQAAIRVSSPPWIPLIKDQGRVHPKEEPEEIQNHPSLDSQATDNDDTVVPVAKTATTASSRELPTQAASSEDPATGSMPDVAMTDVTRAPPAIVPAMKAPVTEGLEMKDVMTHVGPSEDVFDHDMIDLASDAAKFVATHEAAMTALGNRPITESQSNADEVQSLSDGSSPVQPVLRKSSLNLASLPAREPLKKSIGQRTSQMSHVDGDAKTTTQRLHEKINLLKQAPWPAQPPDGPLSASKARITSILKSARGMMARSAGASAQAKMETFSPRMSPSRRPESPQTMASTSTESSLKEEMRALEEEKRRERELERAAKETQKMERQLEEAREKERQKAAAQSQAATQAQKSKEVRRPPVKRGKEAPAKPKPAPVAIRVGTASQLTASQRDLDHRKAPQNPPANAALASNLQNSLAPPAATAAPKRPEMQRKPSSSSQTSTMTTNSFKNSTSSKPKALLAAARKKEQEEREAQRKLTQKREMEREMERRRAAQQEQERRHEQQQREEADRQRDRERAATAEDPKKIAQKKAIEKRRLELAKKTEQQKRPLPPPHAPAKAQNTLAHSLEQEKPQAPPTLHRGELGNARPVAKMNASVANPRPPLEESIRTVNPPQLNPAKPPKRMFEPEPTDEQPYRPLNMLDHNQANNPKRRKTNENDEEEPIARQPMAPPVRQSSNRKEVLQKTIFSHGYSNAPTRPGPVRASKSSPKYRDGDEIELPEIDTDSEGEDDDKKDFVAPDWATSPALRSLLVDQQLVDPEEVFGPIAPLHMEEIFRNKDRHHRFRSRTSSANWSGQDRLTQEEVQRDLEARERLIANGGWTYDL